MRHHLKKLGPALALLLLVSGVSTAAASVGEVQSFYLLGQGATMSTSPGDGPTMRYFEQPHAQLPYFTSSEPLREPLVVAAEETFRLHLHERTAFETAAYTTHVRVALATADGRHIAYLGEARVTTGQDGVPASLSEDVPQDGWRDLRFDLNASLLAPGEDAFTIPTGTRLRLEVGLAMDERAVQTPKLLPAYDTAVEILQPAIDALPGRTDVAVPLTPTCCRVWVDPQDHVETTLKAYRVTVGDAEDRIQSFSPPTSYFEYGSPDAPSRLDVRLSG